MAAHFVAVKGCRTGICRGGALLAFLPYKGRGIEQSDTEAAKWYLKAAEQGYAKAQNGLGDCYYNDQGVEQSYIGALKWFRKALEQLKKR